MQTQAPTTTRHRASTVFKHTHLRVWLLLACALGALSACSHTQPSTNPQTTATNKVSRGQGITFKGGCTQKEEDNYQDQLTLEIVNNQVQALDWTAHPRQGVCRFKLEDFTQVASQPQTDLQAKRSAKCHIYVWQDARFITVASNNCQSICAVNNHVLPVLLDPNTRGCSQVSR